MKLRIGLVGLGKIARDQHVPAIEATPGAGLIAVASRNATLEGARNYRDLRSMLVGEPDLNAIVLCQPPQVRYEAAALALKAGKHVFLEKPPGATLSEVAALSSLAKACGVSLLASWHSRYGAGVEPARHWLVGQSIRRGSIAWKEDVRHWHPRQDWIWRAGGFGVFDPGINALSILTALVEEPILLKDAVLEVPNNRQAPIAAWLSLQTANCAPIGVEFDWRQTGRQTWDIAIETDAGSLLLSDGGNTLSIDGQTQTISPESEYPAMYRHFAKLVEEGRSEVDSRPLGLVADAFLCGQYRAVEAFYD